ncbi:MAG: hypothetical protein IH914_01310 [candidate division Zixibacteria bacterium]|nr:hypothetical protein [candidate division Zixibacteria bacterium]
MKPNITTRRRSAWSAIVPAAVALALIVSSLAGARGLDERVTLNLEKMPLDDALSMIAAQYKLNMVVSGADKQIITLHLNSVSLKDALDAMLLPNGFNYYQRGEVIVVSSGANAGIGGMETMFYRLKYASASTAKIAVETIKSQYGKVEILNGASNGDGEGGGPTVIPNALIIHDFPDNVLGIKALLAKLDVPDRMIMIEVKMIETKVDELDILGFNLPKSITARISNTTSTGSSVATSGSGNTASAGFIDLPNGRWDWGTLSVDELAATLDFLQSSGKSKLISHPKLATLENHEAEFKVTTIIPVQTVNRFTQGSATSDIVTFQDIEVGITLRVTPRINDSGVITMDVFPQVQEIISFTGTLDQQKPITTQRSVHTVVTCKAGETIVIGGLLRENEIIREEKVFLLGDIPFLGGLFRHKRTEKETTDLLILITPTVMSSATRSTP